MFIVNCRWTSVCLYIRQPLLVLGLGLNLQKLGICFLEWPQSVQSDWFQAPPRGRVTFVSVTQEMNRSFNALNVKIMCTPLNFV